MPGKGYGRVGLNARVMKMTAKSVGYKEGSFRKGKECMDLHAE